MTYYLSTEEVLRIHEAAIDQFGGSHGLRDLGLLESAIARPQAGFGDFEAYPDLFLKVAVFGFSLLKNHPFLDGNKRTATIAMGLMLKRNGYRIRAKRGELYRLAMAIENNSLPEAEIAQWLKEHGKKIE